MGEGGGCGAGDGRDQEKVENRGDRRTEIAAAKPESVSGGAGSPAVGSCGICRAAAAQAVAARRPKGSGGEFSGPCTSDSFGAGHRGARPAELPTAAVAPEAARRRRRSARRRWRTRGAVPTPRGAAGSPPRRRRTEKWARVARVEQGGRQAGWFDLLRRTRHGTPDHDRERGTEESSMIGWPTRPIHEMMRSAAQGHSVRRVLRLTAGSP